MLRLVGIAALGASLLVTAFGGEIAPTLGDAKTRNRAKPKPGPDVLVVSELFAKKAKEMTPQSGKPVYYYLLGGKERAIGDLGSGKGMPPPAEVEEQVVTALAAYGFVRTDVGGPKPALVVFISYGTASLSYVELEDTNPETDGNTTEGKETVFFNYREIANIVGFGQADKHLMSNFASDQLNGAANDDRLYVTVAAFDAEQLARQKKKLLWRTIMSIHEGRETLIDSLPVMLASGAGYFGKETDRPEFVDDVDRKARVELGELKVLGVVDDDDSLQGENEKPVKTKPRR